MVIGEKNKKEKLFYYFRPEELIPEGHILRLIDRHVDFSFVRSKVQHLYSHTGRPSVDPEMMMRMLLVGYLFGITSERRLCDEVQMHVGYRWFVGLSLEDKVPDHSTFSKNRHPTWVRSSIEASCKLISSNPSRSPDDSTYARKMHPKMLPDLLINYIHLDWDNAFKAASQPVSVTT